MADWSKPTLTSLYTDFVTEVKNRDEDIAKQFDGTTSTSIPTGAVRWDSTDNRWKKWSGTAWAELTAAYNLNALNIAGVPAVTTTGTQTLTNKTLTSPTVNGGTLSGTLAGNHTKSGQVTFSNPTAPIVSARIGANASQQHTIPAVESDTVALLAAAQTLTNKILTNPTIAAILNGGTLTLPTGTDTLVGRATTDTLTNKTLTSPAVNGGAINNATVGATTPNTGAFTSLAASGDVTFSGTGRMRVPTGSIAQRPATPQAGWFRFNNETNQFEGYNGSAWGAVGAGATGGTGNAVFYENDQVVTQSYTITNGKNAMSAGVITIDSGVTVTVPSGSFWVIV